MTGEARENGISPQERDFLLLRGLFESRLMTVRHVAALYFEGKLEAAKKRLQKLKGADLIRDRPRQASDPSVLSLSKKGFTLLKLHQRLDGYPAISDGEFELRSRVSALTLRHELAVMDVKAALVPAISNLPNFRIAECMTWPLLAEFSLARPASNGYGAVNVTVKPDGFLCVHEHDDAGVNEYCFYLEVDRGTESQRVLAERAIAYRAHFRSGGFAEARNGRREAFEEYPFRVLAIFKTVERRNNAAERLLLIDPPIKTILWLTTMPEVLRDPLGSIWMRPVDYQRFIHGSGCEIESPLRLPRYYRNAARDAHIKYLLKLHPLFVEE